MRIWAQLLFILLFSALLVSCRGNTSTPQAIPSPSPQPSATTIPTPVPTDTFFPQANEPVQDKMLGQILGKLILVDSCPRAEASSNGSSFLLFWPYNYTIDRSADPAQIRDDTGQVVARIGDYVEMGGGNVPDSANEKLPNGCAGPLWIVGEGPRVLDRYFPEEVGAGGFSSMTDLLEGTLVVVNGCLRLQTDENKSFLLLWWPGRYIWDKNASQVYGSYDNIRVQIGEKIKVEGGEAPFVQSPPGDFTKPMVMPPLPKECATGPYWNVVYIRE